MFIKAPCPVCGSQAYYDIRLSALEYLHFEGEKQACIYIIENIEVKYSLPEEEFVEGILRGVQEIVHDGIQVEFLIKVLGENYGVAGSCCMDLIEKIKLELDMYCPDNKRLYFAESEEPGSYMKRRLYEKADCLIN